MRCLGLLMLLTLVLGCDSGRVSTYPVRGHVQFADGDPVRVGTIELESLEFGTNATGRIQEDGSFVLGTYEPTDGAAEGEHRVIVVQIIVNDGTLRHTKDHGRPVSRQYGSYSTSDLVATVEPRPDNQIVVKLPSQ